METMEVMLALVTDDFHDSFWTNQEVGYALGKGVPIISVKLQQKDPAGFIGSAQALRGRLDSMEGAATIYKLLVEKLGRKRSTATSSDILFTSSPPSWEAAHR